MTNFEKITASPEALGEFLAALPAATGPWDGAFHREFWTRTLSAHRRKGKRTIVFSAIRIPHMNAAATRI